MNWQRFVVLVTPAVFLLERALSWLLADSRRTQQVANERAHERAQLNLTAMLDDDHISVEQRVQVAELVAELSRAKSAQNLSPRARRLVTREMVAEATGTSTQPEQAAQANGELE